MNRLRIAVGLACLLAASPLLAAVSEAQFERLRADLMALAERVQVLEAENRQLRDSAAGQTPAPGAEASGLNWSDRIEVSGDFRYRYEEIDVEDRPRRERNRIRARALIRATLPHDVEIGTGFASGGDDPVSANQTLGGAGSRKELGLDLAYARWQPVDEFYLAAGKMKNVFYRPQKSGLLWDGDYNPEGVGAGWSNDLVFLTGGANWLESDSSRSNRQLAWGVQGGLTLAVGPMALTTGVGYYDLPVAGNASFFGDPDDFFGNSFICADPESAEGCVYLYDYEELEWFLDLGIDQFALPVKLYADVVQNLAVDEADTGWLLGLRLGKAKDRGTWQLGYEYQDLEADAVFGLLSDSDFAGGGTDARGHKLLASYALSRSTQLGITWYINNEFGGSRLEDPIDYDRVMFDAKFKY